MQPFAGRGSCETTRFFGLRADGRGGGVDLREHHDRPVADRSNALWGSDSSAGTGGKRSRRLDVAAEVALDSGVTGLGVTRRFASVAGVSARLTGKQILRLADRTDVYAITENVPMVASAYSSMQQWPYAAG